MIACNIENANIEYTYDVNDGNSYSPHFIEALSRLLASNLAMSLVGNTAVQQMQYQLYQVAITKASEQSAKERLRILERPNSYMSARKCNGECDNTYLFNSTFVYDWGNIIGGIKSY